MLRITADGDEASPGKVTLLIYEAEKLSTNTLEKFINLDFLKRTEVILRAAEVANNIFEKKYPETFKDLNTALSKCNNFIRTGKVDPDELAIYVDGDELERPFIQEALFLNNSAGMHALVFIVMAIGHVAHCAYVHSDARSQMSEIIGEANEFILRDIFEYGDRYALPQLVESADRSDIS